MKRKNLLQNILVMLFLSALVFSCENPSDVVDDTTTDDVTSAVKIGFETWDVENFYDAESTDALTGVTIEQSTEQAIEGTNSLKMVGNLQKDKYGNTLEVASRVKADVILGEDSFDLIGKVISVDYYAAAGSVNDQVQFIIYDGADQNCMSSGTVINLGEWNTVYYKVLAADHAENTSSTAVIVEVTDATGETIVQGTAYTSDTFDGTTVKYFEIRTIGGDSVDTPDNIGAEATLYVDSIDWE